MLTSIADIIIILLIDIREKSRWYEITIVIMSLNIIESKSIRVRVSGKQTEYKFVILLLLHKKLEMFTKTNDALKFRHRQIYLSPYAFRRVYVTYFLTPNYLCFWFTIHGADVKTVVPDAQ